MKIGISMSYKRVDAATPKPGASFHGKYVNFDGIACNPKPAQRPGPPVLIGSADRNALKWVARWRCSQRSSGTPRAGAGERRYAAPGRRTGFGIGRVRSADRQFGQD